jgi:ribosomal protein L17
MFKNTILLLITIFASAAYAHSSDSEWEDCSQEVVVQNIESQLDACRLSIKELSHGNAKVLAQYDQFAETLKEVYLSGEGLIHKDLQRIIDAMIFSAKKHQLQTRKDPEQTPYIVHPLGVAHLLMTVGKVRDADIIIGALLHDTVEDTQTTFEEIEQRFGARVTGFVREVTDDKSLPKATRKQLQIEHASHKSAGAAQIKLADKLYNLTDLAKAPPTDWEVERVDTYFRWAQSVVDRLPWVNAPLKRAVDEVIQDYLE